MKNSIKYTFIIALLMLFCIGSVYGQTETNKKDGNQMISISKKEFVNVISDVVKEREKKKEFKKAFKNRKKHEQFRQHSSDLNGENQYEKRLFRLESQVSQLMMMLIDNSKTNKKTTSYVIPRESLGSKDTTIVQINERILVNPIEKTNKNRDTVVIHTKEKIIEKIKDSVVSNAEKEALKKKLNELIAQTEKLKAILKEKEISKKEPIRVSEHIKKEIFFANNQFELPLKYIETINEISQILKSNSNLSLAVRGFSSKTGNAAYNQKLSLKRANTVKGAIISKGIDSGRIVTTYHGEDLNRSEAESRRVEVIIEDNRR